MLQAALGLVAISEPLLATLLIFRCASKLFGRSVLPLPSSRLARRSSCSVDQAPSDPRRRRSAITRMTFRAKLGASSTMRTNAAPSATTSSCAN